MRKIDEEVSSDKDMPLLSQNISIIEVGAYSQKFGKFLNFIGLKKCLILTDIDIAEIQEGNSHKVACQYDASKTLYTTNSAIKKYLSTDKLSEIINLDMDKRLFSWDETTKEWKVDNTGNMCLCYQQEEKSYQARSFEDNFFHINKDFFSDTQNYFEEGLKPSYLKKFKENTIDAYALAEKAVESKSALAIEILMNSKENETGDKHYVNWDIPSYIKEGLLWLRKD